MPEKHLACLDMLKKAMQSLDIQGPQVSLVSPDASISETCPKATRSGAMGPNL